MHLKPTSSAQPPFLPLTSNSGKTQTITPVEAASNIIQFSFAEECEDKCVLLIALGVWVKNVQVFQTPIIMMGHVGSGLTDGVI
jgi:hypothetical protein